MTQADLTLSAAAAKLIQAIGQAEGRAVMLRVAVEGGGCTLTPAPAAAPATGGRP